MSPGIWNTGRGPWSGPLLLVRALRRSREGDVPPDWSHLCPGIKSVDLDCGHMEILSPAFAPALAALIVVGQALAPAHPQACYHVVK